MGHTYRYSVSVGSCCVAGLLASLEETFSKDEVAVRVSSVRKCVEFETLNDPDYHYTHYLRFIRAIQKQGHDCEEPWMPHWLQGAVGVLLGLAVLVLCLFAPALPLAAMIVAGVISVLSTLALGFQSFKRTWKACKSKRPLTMDFLFTLSTFIALGVSIAAFFFPFLPMLFEVGMLIFGFRHVGLAIESSMLNQIEKEASFQGIAPKQVKVKRHGQWISSELSAIAVGEMIQVAPDQVIPLDGEVQTSQVQVTEKNITGQNGVRVLGQLEQVWAGVKLTAESPYLELKVTRTAKTSYLAKMDEFTNDALGKKTPIEEQSGKALMYFVPIVILIAILSGVFVGVFVGVGAAISCALAVLLSACPCTLGFTVPLGVKTGIEKAARHGLILSSGEGLERAQNIDTVVFDLNGTLTEGKPSMKQVDWFTDEHDTLIARSMLLAIESKVIQQRQASTLKAADCPVSPVIAEAIIQAFTHEAQVKIESLALTTVQSGGVKVMHEGQMWLVGNRTFMQEHDVHVQSEPQAVMLGTQEIWMARDKQVLCHMMLQDALRADARATVLQLQKQKKLVYLCTGADYVTAMRYARELNIPSDRLLVDCVPVQRDEEQTSSGQRLPKRISKFEHIQALQKKGHRVAMVGDGINDAPAMSQSDLGIAMLHDDTDVRTKQNTQIHLAAASLKPLQFLFLIAKQTHRWIKLTLGLSLGYNLISILLASGVLLAAGVVINPVVGAVLMVLQLVLLLVGTYIVHRREVQLPHVADRNMPETSYVQMAKQGLDIQPELSASIMLKQNEQSALNQKVFTTTLQMESGPLVDKVPLPQR